MTPEKLNELERLARAAIGDWPYLTPQDYDSNHYYVQALNPQTCIELIEYIRTLEAYLAKWQATWGESTLSNASKNAKIWELEDQLKTAREDALREAANRAEEVWLKAPNEPPAWLKNNLCFGALAAREAIRALIDKPSAKEGAE